MRHLLQFWLIIFPMLCAVIDMRAEDINQDSDVFIKVQILNGNYDNGVFEVPVNQIKGISIQNKTEYDNPFIHKLIVNTGNTNYEVFLRDVERITYEKRSSGITNAEIKSNTWRFDGDNIVFTIANDHAEFVIYTIDGKICMTKQLPNGQSIVSLANLPNDVYILSLDNKSIKFAKK